MVAVCGARCFRFGTLVENFGTSGAPWKIPGGLWEQQDGHEGGGNWIFIDFGLDFGTLFLELDSLISFPGFFQVCVSRN